MVINKDDGTGEAAAFADAVGIPVLAAIPANDDIRRKSANYEIIGRPGSAVGAAVRGTGDATSPTRRRCGPKPLTQDELLGLFTGDAVGRNVVLEPATVVDMCGKTRDREADRSKSSTTPSERRAHAHDRSRSPAHPSRSRRPRRATGSAATPARTSCARPPRAAGKSETLDAVRARTIRKGPHDQPQSMCPAFGSLRVGLRMRRTATILSGSACCVYGLTFTSHFYGARRTVGYVPFNSETLVTGKLFEDIREAVHKLADPAHYDAIVIINLCVPTASGVPLQLLPKEINGVRIIGIDVPGFGVPTHAEAKDVLAGAMLRYARSEAEPGPVQAPRSGAVDKPTVTLLGEMFPADPVGIGMMLEPLGLAAGPVVPTREWRELYAALDCAAVAAIHPFYTASVREFEAAGRTIVGSAPVGHDGTAAWLQAIGSAANVAQDKIDAAKNRMPAGDQGALAQDADQGPHHAVAATKAPSCWSARLLIESGADVPLCRHRLPAHAVERCRPRMARGQGRARAVPRLARAGPRRDARVPARPRDRHHAGRAGGQGGGDPGALLHQPDLGAPADGPGRRRLARAGGQRGASPTRRASTQMQRLLRRRRHGPRRRRLGRRARSDRPEFREPLQAPDAPSWSKKRKAEEMI